MKKIGRYSALTAIFILALIAACAPKKPIGSVAPPPPAVVDTTQQDMMAKIRHAFDGGDYNAARAEAASFMQKFPSSESAQEAQYVVALSYIREGRDEEARKELNRYIQNYPAGPHASESAATLRSLEAKRLQQLASINAEQARAYEEHQKRLEETVAEMRAAAAIKDKMYIVVDLKNDLVMLKMGDATLYAFPCATGKGWGYLSAVGQEQNFSTPIGRHKVIKKEKDPVWTRPNWYWLERGEEVPEGMSGNERMVAGHLGKYRIDLGDGYGIHGYAGVVSPSKITHGCVRVNSDDLEIIFNLVDIGTDVFIF